MQSQTLSRAKVTSSISPSGDTIISMRLDYAKILLNEVLDKQIADSLLVIYKQKDSLNNDVISIQKNTIQLLQTQGNNKDLQIKNFNLLIDNKDVEITEQKAIIKKQKKEIRKQKILKLIGFTGSIVLPILVLFNTN